MQRSYTPRAIELLIKSLKDLLVNISAQLIVGQLLVLMGAADGYPAAVDIATGSRAAVASPVSRLLRLRWYLFKETLGQASKV